MDRGVAFPGAHAHKRQRRHAPDRRASRRPTRARRCARRLACETHTVRPARSCQDRTLVSDRIATDRPEAYPAGTTSTAAKRGSSSPIRANSASTRPASRAVAPVSSETSTSSTFLPSRLPISAARSSFEALLGIEARFGRSWSAPAHRERRCAPSPAPAPRSRSPACASAKPARSPPIRPRCIPEQRAAAGARFSAAVSVSCISTIRKAAQRAAMALTAKLASDAEDLSSQTSGHIRRFSPQRCLHGQRSSIASTLR